MGCPSCCKYCCGVTVLLLALLFSPLLLFAPSEVLVDDVASWGLKGPGLGLTPNMRGVFYLSGNQTPKPCSEEDKKDPQKCRGKWARSPGIVFDTSYCVYEAEKKLITCPSAAPWMGAGGPKAKKILPLLAMARIKYVINKGDPEFASRPADSFDGSMKLSMFGIPATLLAGWDYSYRITMMDSCGFLESCDGSRIMRYTWWNVSNTPQPISEADSEWTYEIKRFYDGKSVDTGVTSEIKKIWGDTVVIGVPKLGVGSALAGLLNLFTMDYRFMPI